jgi:glycosyltransferase involved in cell wall biosynthesis
MKVIAYLSQEIPSLSATFVYDEILALQKRGVKVIPISIKHPNLNKVELAQNVQALFAQTSFIYQRKSWQVFQDNLSIFFKDHKRYLATLKMTLRDIEEMGLFNLNALKLIYHFLQASPVAKILINNHCEHLHIHFAHVPTQVGMYSAAIANIPFSFTAHANDLFERGYLIEQKVDRAKFVVTISDYNYNFLKTKVKDIEKIKVIHCGIDLDTYQFLEKNTFNPKIIIKSLGRLVEKKGMDILILAAHELKKRDIDFVVEIGGSGPLNAELIKLIEQHGLSSHVFLTGAIPHQQVFQWLQQADLFVLACKQDGQGDQDGIPVVLMEAMAMGIPVISTTISGIPELIEDGISGLLASPNNSQALADKILQAISLDYDILKTTQAARSTIITAFNIEKNAEQLLTLF